MIFRTLSFMSRLDQSSLYLLERPKRSLSLPMRKVGARQITRSFVSGFDTLELSADHCKTKPTRWLAGKGLAGKSAAEHHSASQDTVTDVAWKKGIQI